MKIRKGFVSNSSSCSFVLDKCDMTPLHIAKFRQVIDLAEAEDDDTCIHSTDKHFVGTVSMHDKHVLGFLAEHGLQADMVM